MNGFSLKYLILGIIFFAIGPFLLRNSLKGLKKFDGWYSESVKVGEFGTGVIMIFAGGYLLIEQFLILIN